MEKYRGDAEAFSEFKPFAEQLKANGQKFDEVLSHYTGMENLLARDPIAGFELIARNIGTDLQTIAAHYLNRPADEVSTAQNGQITSLHNEIAALKEQLSGVTTTISSQREQETLNRLTRSAPISPGSMNWVTTSLFSSARGKQKIWQTLRHGGAAQPRASPGRSHTSGSDPQPFDRYGSNP